MYSTPTTTTTTPTTNMKHLLLTALLLAAFYVATCDAGVSIRNCTRFATKKVPIACPTGTYRYDYTCVPYCMKRYDECTCDVIEYEYDVVWWMYWDLTPGCPFDWQVKINGKCMQRACQFGGVRRDENFCAHEQKLYNCSMLGPKTPTQCPANSDAFYGYCLSEKCPAPTERQQTDFCLCLEPMW